MADFFFQLPDLESLLVPIVKYILAKLEISAALRELENGVKDLALPVDAKNALLGAIKRAISLIDGCDAEDMPEAYGEIDASKFDFVIPPEFAAKLSAARRLIQLVYWKRYHDTRQPKKGVTFTYDPKTGNLTVVDRGGVENTFKSDPANKEAGDFIQKFIERFNACAFPTRDDGQKFDKFFKPA
jgi:hypothetical protein